MHVAAHVYMCVCVHVKPQRSTDPSAYFHEAMGRLKGIVEVTLEGTEVSQVAADLKQAMPDVVKGAVSVDAGKMFDEYASHSFPPRNRVKGVVFRRSR